jgi:hypothetical protein
MPRKKSRDRIGDEEGEGVRGVGDGKMILSFNIQTGLDEGLGLSLYLFLHYYFPTNSELFDSHNTVLNS